MINEVNSKDQNTDSEIEAKEGSDKTKSLMFKAVMSIFAFYFSWTLIQALKTGAIWYKRDHEYFLDTQPEGFYLVVTLHIVFITTALYIVFKDFSKKTPDKDN